MEIQTMAEIIDEFRNLYLDKKSFYEFFDGFEGSIEDQEDPSEIEPLNTFFKSNADGVNTAFAYLFQDIELGKNQESLIQLTFNNLCDYFDADPDSEDYEDLADVLSAGS
jgi:hypothetical protein